MPAMTYSQHVQKVLSLVVRDGDDRVSYERIMTKIVTRKRWSGEEPAPHHRRLIHGAIMREVWAKRVTVVGSDEARIVNITDGGTAFYLAWTEPQPNPGGRPGWRMTGSNRGELLVKYNGTATLLLSLQNLFQAYVSGHAFLEVKNLPDLTRAILQTESYQQQHNSQLSVQITDGDARIKILEAELRKRGTAVTTSDVVDSALDR